MSRTLLPPGLRRVDAVRVAVDGPPGCPVTLLANPQVPVEADAIDELRDFLALSDSMARLPASFWGHATGAFTAVVLTPDFHRGSGIPVGTVADLQGVVVPRAIGTDIGCGMRLLVTDLPASALEPHVAAVKSRLREIHFGGQRDIPLSPRQREALLRRGLAGLVETCGDNGGTGIWRLYDPAAQRSDLERAFGGGDLEAREIFAFGDYVRSSGQTDGRDAHIGSVGGGNHFVELQAVDEILDGSAAHAWGVARGNLAIMVHTGSLGLGHVVGDFWSGRARELHPRGLAHPGHGFYPLPTTGPHAGQAAAYLDAMANAVNFAFGNRLFLGLMALRALGEVLGRTVQARLVYDLPHNVILSHPAAPDRWIHRKGACPATGPEPMREGSPFRYHGHPVIIPGSMGASSWLLMGEGNADLLESACHGAGRALSRGQAAAGRGAGGETRNGCPPLWDAGAARCVDDATYQGALSPLHVVTPVDPDSPTIRRRRDILDKLRRSLAEEAPFAYKPITPVIETVRQARVAQPVARLRPLVTVKG